MQTQENLPESVTTCNANDKEISIIATAHVSHQSVADVKKTVELINPDSICIELCASRHKALTNKDTWKKMNIFQVIKNGKASLLLAQLIMSSFYQRLGNKLNIQPGAEMLEGAELAEKRNIPLVLADREVEITLKRVWRNLSFWGKLKMFSQILGGLFEIDDIDDEMVEELKKGNQLEDIMQTFATSFPEIKERLIDERDLYLAQKIRMAPGKKVVAVVGAGHVQGLLSHLHEEKSVKELETIPPPSKVGKTIMWLIPIIMILFPFYAYFSGSTQVSIDYISVWMFSHIIFAGAGAALAFGHPLTILVSSLSSPFTSLNPMIAAGWLGGLTQAWVKKPTVEDLEKVPTEIRTLRGFWRNPLTRILLVVVLANLGSTLGTFFSGTWIVKTLLMK